MKITRNTPLTKVTELVADQIATLKSAGGSVVSVPRAFKYSMSGIRVEIGGYSADARSDFINRFIIWAVFIAAVGWVLYEGLSATLGWSLGSSFRFFLALIALVPAGWTIKFLIPITANRWNSGLHQALKDAQGAKEFEEICVKIIAALWTLRNLPLFGWKQSYVVAVFDFLPELLGKEPNANSSAFAEDKLIAGLNDLLEGKFAKSGVELNAYIKNVFIESRIKNIEGLFPSIDFGKSGPTGFARGWLRSISIPARFANWATSKLGTLIMVIGFLAALGAVAGGFAR